MSRLLRNALGVGFCAGQTACGMRPNGHAVDPLDGTLEMVTDLKVRRGPSGQFETVIARTSRKVYAELLATLWVRPQGSATRIDPNGRGFDVVVHMKDEYYGQKPDVSSSSAFKLYVMDVYWGALTAFVEGFKRGYAEGYGDRAGGAQASVSLAHRMKKYAR